MSTRERGAALLIPVILVITVAAFAVVVAASRSGGDVQSNDANVDAIQALYLAETGLERQLKRFATGTACTSLGDDPTTGGAPETTHTITNLAELGMGNGPYSITFVNGLTTDFASQPLVSSQTQCRIPVTATVVASNISRTIHAIVDINLLRGSNNHNFNNTSAAAVTGWTFSPAGVNQGFQNNGGADGTYPTCRRSAYMWIPAASASTTASGSTLIPAVPVNITVASPSTTTVYFHRRIINRGAGCGAYAGAATFACGAATQGGTICFRLTTSGVPATWLSTNHNVNPSVTLGAVGCPYVPPVFAAPCDTNYNPPVYPAKSSVTIAHAGGAALRNVTNFEYSMRLQDTVAPEPVYAGARELFLDNIEVVNTSALNAARVHVWRDCTSAANPATCL